MVFVGERADRYPKQQAHLVVTKKIPGSFGSPGRALDSVAIVANKNSEEPMSWLLAGRCLSEFGQLVLQGLNLKLLEFEGSGANRGQANGTHSGAIIAERNQVLAVQRNLYLGAVFSQD